MGNRLGGAGAKRGIEFLVELDELRELPANLKARGFKRGLGLGGVEPGLRAIRSGLGEVDRHPALLVFLDLSDRAQRDSALGGDQALEPRFQPALERAFKARTDLKGIGEREELSF